MRIALILVVFTLLSISAFAAPCPNNLLTNGSFENGTTAWTITDGTATVSTTAKDGAKALRICPSGALMRMYQYVNATAGTQYTFSASVRMDAQTGGSPQMFVKFMAANWSMLDTKFKATTISSTYTDFSITATAPTGTVRIELGFIHNGGCQLIDDACLLTGSAPTTCELTATATEITCLDNNTPNVTTDDRWTCKLTVVPTGSGCAGQTSNVWYSTPNGIGNYNSPSQLANSLLISNGAVTFQFVDAQNPALTGSLVVQPPAVCSTPPSAACTNNLASNGGFEFNFNEWASAGATIVSSAATGTKAAVVCNNQSLRQTKPSAIGQAMSLTLKARSTVAGAKVLAYIKYLNGSWSPLVTEFKDVAPGTSAFTEYTLSKAAPAGTAYVEIGFFNFNPGCVLIDDVCLSNDPCGNDIIKPTITCPANITVQSTNGTNAIATWAAPVATDNCPGAVTLSTTHSPGQAFAVGTTTITYTARDAAQNSTQCAFAVVVQNQSTVGQCGFTRFYPLTQETNPSAFVTIYGTSATGYTLRSEELLRSDSIRWSSMQIGSDGSLLSTASSAFKTEIAHTRLTDGSVVEAVATSLTTLILRKRNAQGSLLWSKNLTVVLPANPGQPVVETQVNSLIQTQSGNLLISGAFLNAMPTFIEYSQFLLETDASGNQVRFKEFPGNVIGQNSFGSLYKTQTGSLYLTRIGFSGSAAFYKLDQNLNPNFLFGITGQYPQGYAFEESTNGLAGFVLERNVITGADQVRIISLLTGADLQALNLSYECATPTVDGGLIGVFDENLQKLDQNGAVLWSKQLNPGYQYHSIKELSTGGYLISGRVQGQWLIMRTDAQGNLLPDCNGAITFPDLAVSNASFVASTMARGTSSQIKFDVRNLANAPASASKAKFYLTDSLTILNLLVGEANIPAMPANGQLLHYTGTITIESNWFLGFLPKEFKVIVTIDSEQIVQEVSETNNTSVSLGRLLVTDAASGGSDLALTITSDRTNVPQWSSMTARITATNQSQASIASATIDVGLCGNQGNFEFSGANKLVYGAPPVAPVGSTYNQVAQVWQITNLAAGQSITLELPLFTLGAQTYRLMAWTTAQAPLDPDSQPSSSPLALSNGTCTVSQDDEAVLVFGNTLQLQSSDQTHTQVIDSQPDALLYPNPAVDFITLNLSGYAHDVEIDVIDAQGLLRHTHSYTHTNIHTHSGLQIPVTDLSPGLYIVRLRSAGVRERVLRFVVVGM